MIKMQNNAQYKSQDANVQETLMSRTLSILCVTHELDARRTAVITHAHIGYLIVVHQVEN